MSEVDKRVGADQLHNDDRPIRSIFPTFDVDVPMPGDTAVPGSFRAVPDPSTDAPVRGQQTSR